MAERPLFDPTRISVPPAERLAPAIPMTVTPSRVNELIGGAIHRHVPSTLHVLGEIGDFSRAGSGHMYFTLKDAQSELRCVMWRSAAIKLKFQPAVGMEVIATGGIEVYSPRGTYQLIVRSLEPRGVGALEIAFRQLREKLEKEGLFDPRRKRPLPRFPRRVAIITSPVGAAIRDILQTMARRFPAVEVLIVAVRVQGDGAADEIARAIRLLNENAAALGGIDVAIVGRGGGSLEDLWVFNEEVVARAIVASAIPIVSAVGHEVDVTISDLVADVRAATPTAAAELITPLMTDLCAQIDLGARRVARAAGHVAERARHALERLAARHPLARPQARIEQYSQRLDECGHRLALALSRRLQGEHAALARAAAIVARFGAGAEFARVGRLLESRLHRVQIALERRLSAGRRRALTLESRAAAASPGHQLPRLSEHLRDSLARADRAAEVLVDRQRQRLQSRFETLVACDPRRILGRGYSITRDARTGRILRSIREIAAHTRIRTELADGDFRSTTDDPRQPRLFE